MKELREPEDDDGFMPFIRRTYFYFYISQRTYFQPFLRRCALLKNRKSPPNYMINKQTLSDN